MSRRMSTLPMPSIQLARSLQVGVTVLADMEPFQLFKSQVESGSTEAAVDSMKRLPVVAIAMGEGDASRELLPYLTQMVMQNPPPVDEVLLLLGQHLIGVSNFLADPIYVKDFLPMLERLAAVEETVVRDQAVAVMVHLAKRKVDPSPWISLLKRLASADWFTAKVSAAGIVAAILGLVEGNTSLQTELLSTFKDLCQDETPMVRRAAAKNLGYVIKEAGWAHREFAGTTLPALCRDEQDSVRLLAVSSLANVGDSFSEHPQWTIQNWLPIVKDGSTDMSWNVRNNLAKNFSDVAVALGIHTGDRRFNSEQSLVMACFVALLTDAEAEVRAAAVAHLARMIAFGGQVHFQTHLQPLLPTLADDLVMDVRSKCALALMDAAHGGALEDGVVVQSFGPLLESFLSDEFHEVQLQVLTNLYKISRLLPMLSGVVATLLQMSKATNWRVREAISQLLPHLAEARGLEFFASVLFEPAWCVLLLDTVASVRSAIVNGTGLLVRVAGQDWITQNLFPRTIGVYNQYANSYLVRNTILRTHIEIAVEAKSGPAWDEAVKQVSRSLIDKVPNVRMLAAKGMGRIIAEGDEAVVQEQLIPALQARLDEETDEDCRDACTAALESMSA